MPPTQQDIISRVTGAAIRIIHESYLPETKLWPKHGFIVGNRTRIADVTDVVLYSARIARDEPDGPAWHAIYFELMSKKERRSISQHKHLDRIMDSSIYDGVLFTKYEYVPGLYYENKCPFTDLFFSMAIYNFTIND